MLAWRAWIAMKVREPFWMAIQAVKKNTQAKVSTKKTSVPANKRKTVTNIDAPSASMLEFGNYFEGKYVSLLCLKKKHLKDWRGEIKNAQTLGSARRLQIEKSPQKRGKKSRSEKGLQKKTSLLPKSVI